MPPHLPAGLETEPELQAKCVEDGADPHCALELTGPDISAQVPFELSLDKGSWVAIEMILGAERAHVWNWRGVCVLQCHLFKCFPLGIRALIN